MSKLYALSLLLFCCLSCTMSEPNFEEANANANAGHHQNTLIAEADADTRNGLGDTRDSNYDKRVERYAFGLGRRAYTYTSGGSNGVKRLPVYNFGLGKRARPYSFGLGKRSDYDDEYEGNDFDRALMERAYMEEKRSRPYSFGLGKRDGLEEVDRRGYPNRYGFGLGRR